MQQVHFLTENGQNTLIELDRLRKKTNSPLMTELKMKDKMLEKCRARENDLLHKLEALREILKCPKMYKEFQSAKL